MIDPKKLAEELAKVQREIARNQPAMDAAARLAREVADLERHAAPGIGQPLLSEMGRQIETLRETLEVPVRRRMDELVVQIEAIKPITPDVPTPQLDALREQITAVTELLPPAVVPPALSELSREIDEAMKAPILATVRELERAMKQANLDEIEALSRQISRQFEMLPRELRSEIEVPVVELTPELGYELFDRRAREWLGISGEEFLLRWDAGEYRNADEECPEVIRLASLMPLAR